MSQTCLQMFSLLPEMLENQHECNENWALKLSCVHAVARRMQILKIAVFLYVAQYQNVMDC